MIPLDRRHESICHARRHAGRERTGAAYRADDRQTATIRANHLTAHDRTDQAVGETGRQGRRIPPLTQQPPERLISLCLQFSRVFGSIKHYAESSEKVRANFPRSSLLAVCRRDFTVPIGTASISAICANGRSS